MTWTSIFMCKSPHFLFIDLAPMLLVGGSSYISNSTIEEQVFSKLDAVGKAIDIFFNILFALLLRH